MYVRYLLMTDSRREKRKIPHRATCTRTCLGWFLPSESSVCRTPSAPLGECFSLPVVRKVEKLAKTRPRYPRRLTAHRHHSHFTSFFSAVKILQTITERRRKATHSHHRVTVKTRLSSKQVVENREINPRKKYKVLVQQLCHSQRNAHEHPHPVPTSFHKTFRVAVVVQEERDGVLRRRLSLTICRYGTTNIARITKSVWYHGRRKKTSYYLQQKKNQNQNQNQKNDRCDQRT